MSQETADSLFRLCIDTEAMINAVKEHSESKIEAEEARSTAKIKTMKSQTEATIRVLKEHSDAAIKAIKDYLVASNSFDSDGSATGEIKAESNTVKNNNVEEAHRRSGGMRILVRNMSGKEIWMQVKGSMTVYELKRKITRQFNILVDQQRLLFGSRLLLRDESTLGSMQHSCWCCHSYYSPALWMLEKSPTFRKSFIIIKLLA